MRTGPSSVSLLALLVLTAGSAGADAVKLPPDIRQATVDTAAETLLLDGDFACKGGQLPAVQLSGIPLAVLSVSTTQVLAQLPAGTPSGSYRVRVDCGPAKSDVFEVTIGAAGPKGEPVSPDRRARWATRARRVSRGRQERSARREPPVRREPSGRRAPPGRASAGAGPSIPSALLIRRTTSSRTAASHGRPRRRYRRNA